MPQRFLGSEAVLVFLMLSEELSVEKWMVPHMEKTEKYLSKQNMEHLPDGSVLLQRAWPQLGRMLYQLEHDAIDRNEHLDEGQKRELRTKIKEILLDQCRSYERQYEAFEYVMRGRAGEIVGNPSYVGADGREHELPYTGLEGCYAGSEAKPGRPGLTAAQIVEEEANIGLELLKRLKKEAIENYTWASYARLCDPDHHRLDRDDLKRLNLLWTRVVHRLNQRIYENEEYKKTPLEQVETIVRSDPRLACDPAIQQEYVHLQEQEEGTQDERAQGRKRRLANDRLFRDRREEHDRFRRETYTLLKDLSGRLEHIDYHVEDATFADANILEELRLPKLPDRQSSPHYRVKLTPEQVEGYLFLARLGEQGGDPLARSILTAEAM